MKKIKFLLDSVQLLLILLFVLSCNNHKRGSQLASFNKDFNEAKQSFPDSLVDHFPKTIALPAHYGHDLGSDDMNISLQLNLQLDGVDVDSIESSLKARALANYRADDSCLLVVNRFVRSTEWGLNNTYKKSMDRPENCRDSYFPIPNFWSNEVNSSETVSRLPSEYEIYVLGAKAGVFSNDLNRKWGRYMPESWRDGYSKGVAINKSDGTVIYWTTIW